MIKQAKKFGFAFDYNYRLLGGCAIDAAGVPYPKETADACKASDAVLLGAVGGPKWDSQPGNNRPEKGLLAIREDLGLFANLRPAKIFAPLKSASPIKEEISATDLIFLLFVNLQAEFISATGERMRKTALWEHMTQSVIHIQKLKEL